MRNLRAASQALRLVSDSPRTPYICRICLAQATSSRQFHSTPKTHAEEGPWWKRLQDSMFGTEKSRKAEASREEKRKKKLEDASQRREKGELETKMGARGVEYVVADVVDPYTNGEYVSAQTWDGLERIGGEGWVRKRADGGEQYHGFITRKQTQLTDAQLEKLLHHVCVEVLALKAAGRDVSEVCNARKEGDAQRTANVSIVVENGIPTLKYEGDASQQVVLEAIQEVLDPESEPISEQSLLDELRSATSSATDVGYNRAWMAFELEDPQMKLAILKRAMQLTGKRISDPAISNANTLAGLFNAFKLKEKPKKLAQDPKMEELAAMGNVQVYASRRTPVHKDKEVGRWKLIQDEFELRGLPEFGTNYPASVIRIKQGRPNYNAQ